MYSKLKTIPEIPNNVVQKPSRSTPKAEIIIGILINFKIAIKKDDNHEIETATKKLFINPEIKYLYSLSYDY